LTKRDENRKAHARSGGDDGQLHVVDSAGNRHRFLRGMVTHDLVQRGLGFEAAYETAQAVRERLADRGEVTTAEIRETIIDALQEAYGEELPASLQTAKRLTPRLHVIYHGQRQPFSRLPRTRRSLTFPLMRATAFFDGLAPKYQWPSFL
jgi:hypothetical protein